MAFLIDVSPFFMSTGMSTNTSDFFVFVDHAPCAVLVTIHFIAVHGVKLFLQIDFASEFLFVRQNTTFDDLFSIVDHGTKVCHV